MLRSQHPTLFLWKKKITFLCVCTCGSKRTSWGKWFSSSTRWVPEVELSCQALLAFTPLSHIAGPPQGLAPVLPDHRPLLIFLLKQWQSNSQDWSSWSTSGFPASKFGPFHKKRPTVLPATKWQLTEGQKLPPPVQETM